MNIRKIARKDQMQRQKLHVRLQRNEILIADQRNRALRCDQGNIGKLVLKAF